MAWAELTDVRCYYEVVGDGDPLFVPGLGGDVPGLGRRRSRPRRPVHLHPCRQPRRRPVRRPSQPRSVADCSSDLVELLDVLQLESAHVLGVSLGGIIAQRFAIDHPSRVDRLVLVTAPPGLRRISSGPPPCWAARCATPAGHVRADGRAARDRPVVPRRQRAESRPAGAAVQPGSRGRWPSSCAACSAARSPPPTTGLSPRRWWSPASTTR